MWVPWLPDPRKEGKYRGVSTPNQGRSGWNLCAFHAFSSYLVVIWGDFRCFQTGSGAFSGDLGYS